MMKSKAKSTIRSVQGDFLLQSNRRHSLCAARVSSRICSPEQSPSPSHTPHRSKVIFAEFVNLSSESRVLSPRQGKSMASLNSSASSSQCPSNGGHPTDSVDFEWHIRTRKRLHATSTRSASTSTSAETAAVEKQSPYCAGPSCNFREDPVSSEAAVMALQPSSSQPPDCKSTKADTSVLVALGQKPNTHKIPRRQYLTRSKAAASSYEGPITVSFQSL
ncbi:hypothetical protein D5086_023268 [Populus alba]|uniref:Uncharacterized protein n=1 Tax=Populus alba TaxID=43335 RepID=A0ACC4BAU6_POPAL